MGLSGELDGWTPVRLEQGPAGMRVDWCYTDGYEFDDPFFDQTLQRSLREPARLLFRRSTLLHEVADPAAPQPSGVIAHMSRCGSTMVSQALVARGDVLSWSEPPIVDQVVRAAAAGLCDHSAVRGMLGIAASRGRPYSVVKLDAWTTIDLPIIRAAAPDVPVVMLIRDPLEVLVSQSRRRGYHMIPGTLPLAMLGLTTEQVAKLNEHEYAALVLGRILRAAHELVVHDDKTRVIDYADLPAALDEVARWFELDTTDARVRAMHASGGKDAKNPVLGFSSDSAAKQKAATGKMRDAIDRWAQPWYERLLRFRTR